MGGGKFSHKKKTNPTTTRRRSGPSSSIQGSNGGFLSDWQLQSSPPTSAWGRHTKPKGKCRSKSANNLEGNKDSIEGTRKSNSNVFGYVYPSVHMQGGLHSESQATQIDEDRSLDKSQPFILLGSKNSKVVAYIDEKPSLKMQDLEYTYDYGTSFVLGESSQRFQDEEELVRNPNTDYDSPVQTEKRELFCIGSSSSGKDMVTDDRCMVGDETANDLLEKTSSGKKYADVVRSPKNSGFLSIGGMKLYTQDISYQQSDDGELSEGSSACSEHVDSSESSESDSSKETYCSDSDIDDEVVADYLEGIGGSKNILNSKWLVRREFVEYEDDDSSGSIDETVNKLGGITLQESSNEFSKKRTPSRKKNITVPGEGWSPLALDDLRLKDTRTASSRKKKNVSNFSRSWPSDARKSKTLRKYPGEKKKYRKETIAAKRRERMLNRGVDLRELNLQLEHMVLNGEDIFSFQPMHSRDCSQVQRLAAIYHLRSGCQGSGKKRFVTVSRTQYTGMPSSSDRIRLEKLIGAGDEDEDFPVVEGANLNSLGGNRSREKKAAAKLTSSSSLEIDSAYGKKSKSSTSKRSSQKKNDKKVSYVDQPVSFVSCGVMQPEPETIEVKTSHINDIDKGKDVIGAFEVHTKGFGSKMMARMGFIEGGGLGKDGQGMASPIEVIKRPKSLGLGVDFSDTSPADSSNQRRVATKTGVSGKCQSIGAFEEHTKGFGSKMMMKMGFVEGMGLGKDSQGIVHPLFPVRRPKARGLGAEGG